MDCVTYQIFLWTIGAILALIGVVWRDHKERHVRVSSRLQAYDKLETDISAIRTDIEWIKRSLQDLKHR